jgi:hypothetical protein
MDKPLHYEIHVTVETIETQRFNDECGAIGVKPLVIHNIKSDGSGVLLDLLTSSKTTGTDEDAFNEMTRVSESLQNKGFNVVRKKVETVPWHPKALIHDENSETGYFETHIPIRIKSPGEAKYLVEVCKGLDLYLSENLSKSLAGGYRVQIATLRRKNTTGTRFKNKVSILTKCMYRLYDLDIEDMEPEIEYAIYDSNVQHDAAWIGQ